MAGHSGRETGAAARRQAAGRCPHCGDESGACHALRCLRCGESVCSRQAMPVSARSPFYPHKHRALGRWCGPLQPLLLGQ